MKHVLSIITYLFFLATNLPVNADSGIKGLPAEAQKIMSNPRYQHANWAVFVKDLETGHTLFKMNAGHFFIPASTSKLVSVAALLNQYGEDYTFKTPVYALGKIDKQGTLDGHVVLVAKGDLVLGGRALPGNKIAYTNFDHIDANDIPGATLTPQDPLLGIQSLAKQIKHKGIRSIQGDVLIDDSLFDTFTKRGNVISPIMINENLFDVEVTPSKVNLPASIQFRPQLSNTQISNKVITVGAGKESDIVITSNAGGDQFEISGTIALDKKNILNTYPIKDPKAFARAALIDALQHEGITIQNKPYPTFNLPTTKEYSAYKPVAVLVSPPLIEFSKLILKVSHNMGANLIPPLLAAAHGKTSYLDGMRYMGQFLGNSAHVSPTEISFGDAAGGNDNYLTPEAMMKILEYFYKMPSQKFQAIRLTLPVMGVDGSLTSVAKNTPAEGHIYAKTGTGIIYNMLQGSFLLTAKALAGYYQTQNNHWVAFYLVVNQGNLKMLMDVLDVNNDLGLIANALYAHSN